MTTGSPRHLRLHALAAAFLALGWTHALATPAGLIEFVVGGVTAVGGDGRDRALEKGSPVESGDRVLTNDGRAQIRFSDGAYVSLAPNSDYLIRRYRYEGRTDGSEEAAFKLVKGAMRTVSGMVGRVNKSAYRLETPTATIGIRGTGGVIAILEDGGTLLTGTSGVWLLSNAAGTMEVGAGNTGYAGPDAARAPQRIADAAVMPVPGISEQPVAFSGTAVQTGSGYVSGDHMGPVGVSGGIDTVIMDGTPVPVSAVAGVRRAGGAAASVLDPSSAFTPGAAVTADTPTSGITVPSAGPVPAPVPGAGAPSTAPTPLTAVPNGTPAPSPVAPSGTTVPGIGTAGSAPGSVAPAPGTATAPGNAPGGTPASVAPYAGVAYAFADPRRPARVAIGNDGSKRTAVNHPSSGSFELKSFDIGRVQANHGGRRGEVVDNAGSSDAIGWGRWIGSAALGGGGGSLKVGANGGLHYFTGVPTALADMPKGQATYHFAGATRPTVGNEQIAPGVLENGRMQVDFDRARVGVQFDVRFPAANLSYAVSTTGGIGDVTQSQVQIQGSRFSGAGPLAWNAADCAAGCTTQISGGFVGAQAAGAGFAYQIRGISLPGASAGTPAHSTTINGAAAFVK